MSKVTQEGTETRLMTFRPELHCPLLMQQEGAGPALDPPLPGDSSRAVFQLTESSHSYCPLESRINPPHTDGHHCCDSTCTLHRRSPGSCSRRPIDDGLG